MGTLNVLKRVFFIISLMGATTFLAYSQDTGTVKKQTEIQFQNIVFGRDVTGIGDLNNDGINDLVVGAPNDFNNQVYVLFLDSNGTVKNHTVIAENQSGFDVNIGAEDDFGNSITNMGDLNNDGNTDIAVGAPFANYGGFDKGGVWILFLNEDGTVKDYQQISDIDGNLSTNLNDEDRFGESLGTLADNDNPEDQKLLVGTPERNGGEGSFFILSLNDTGSVINEKELNNNSSNFNVPSYQLGTSINGINDINNDGLNDIVVGDYDMKVDSIDKGCIWMLLMGKDYSIENYQKITENSGQFNDTLSNDGKFGNSVTSLGDINGDGVHDIAVGGFAQAYKNDTTANRLTGKIWILMLNKDGTVKKSQKIGKGFGNFQDTLKTGDRFGRGLAYIGDLNGDSVPELAVGATGRGADNEGTVYILFLHGAPQSSGINTAEPIRQLNTYPNPVSKSQAFNIQLPGTIKQSTSVKVTIFNMNGQQAHQKNIQYNGQKTLQMHLPELAKGTYQLYMKAGAFQGFSKVVVK